MARRYHNPSPPSPFNLELSGAGDHDHQYYHHLFNMEPQTSFSSSSFSSPIFLTPAQVQGRSDNYREPQKFQFQLLEADHNIVSYGGSCDHDHQTLESEGGIGPTLKLSISKNETDRRNENPSAHEISTSSAKWMSSKMRMMRKMTNPDQTSSSSTSSDDKSIAMNLSSHKLEEEQKLQHPSSQLGTDHMISCSNNSSNNTNNVPIIRVCSDCNTTKTPLWRSGPRGPKSLCNACGIRQRKARRAMAAAAAAASGTTLGVAAASSMKSTSKVQHKDNKPRVASTVPFKKRPYNKLTSSPSSRGRSKKLCFEDFTISMDKKNSSSGTTTTSTSLQRVFPQDEKEAAILLMALSCGLVHG